MRCRTARKLLSRRLDRPLAAGDERALQAHLEGCPGCLDHQGQLVTLWDRLDDAPPVPRTPEQWPVIVAGATWKRRRWAWLEPLLELAPRPALGVAVLAMAIGLGITGATLLVGDRPTAGPPSPTPSFESATIAESFGDVPAGSPAAALVASLGGE